MNTNQRKLIAALSLCSAIVPNLASAAAISGQGTWETALQGRDLDGNLSTFEAYYDMALNITWLADANYASTIYTSSLGLVNWGQANSFALNLNPYASGITGWRLPTTVDVGSDGATYTNLHQGVDYGFNITAHSEMSHMFYVTLGNKAYCSTSGSCTQPNTGLTNTGYFSNLMPANYWSSTEYAAIFDYAWTFNFDIGKQDYSSKTGAYGAYFAWAVHDGDVGAAITSVVPIPAAAWLFGSGLLGLAGLAQCKRMV